MASSLLQTPKNEPPQSPTPRSPQSFHSSLQSPAREPASSGNKSIPPPSPSSSLNNNNNNSANSFPQSPTNESVPSPTVRSSNDLESPSHGSVLSGNRSNSPSSSPMNNRNGTAGNSPLRPPLNHLSIPESPSNNHIQENHKQSPSSNKPILSPKLKPLLLRSFKPSTPIRPPSLNSLTESELSPSSLAIVPTPVNDRSKRTDFDEEAIDSPLRTMSFERSDAPGRISGSGGRGNTVVAEAVWRAEVRRGAILLRVLVSVLCLVSFSVMAADRTTGWDGDSYHRYEEYRYALTVNVIAFVYSTFQLYAEIHRVITMKHLIRRPLSYYMDFIMDQILAYLLMSASSVAASHNDIWVSRFGNDEFTRKINASVVISFFGFIALALSSVISTYVLFRWLA